MVKSDSLLTNQPCECTLTAVGPVKVLVLHGARQLLADYRAKEAANLLPVPPVVDMITYFNGNAQPNNFEARGLAAHDPMDQPPWVLQRLPPWNLTNDGISPRNYSTLLLPSQFRQMMAPVRVLRHKSRALPITRFVTCFGMRNHETRLPDGAFANAQAGGSKALTPPATLPRIQKRCSCVSGVH